MSLLAEANRTTCQLCCGGAESSVDLLKEHPDLATWTENALGINVEEQSAVHTLLCASCISELRNWLLFQERSRNAHLRFCSARGVPARQGRVSSGRTLAPREVRASHPSVKASKVSPRPPKELKVTLKRLDMTKLRDGTLHLNPTTQKETKKIIGKASSCSICYKKYSSQTTMQRHVRLIHHKTPGGFNCHKCDKYFLYTSNLKKHIAGHVITERLFECDICKKKFKTDQDLGIHKYRSHMAKKSFFCKICHKGFILKAALNWHMKVHSADRQYSCDLCEIRFKIKQDLKKHISIVHLKVGPLQCSVCAKAMPSASCLKIHMRVHTGERPFKCNICKKTYTRKESLTEHKKLHSDETPYACTKCDKKFPLACYLRRHLLTHAKDPRPFKCTYSNCKKGFKLPSELKVHLRRHTGEKPFKCSVCDKSFVIKESLKSHMLIHSGNKPFQCTHCPKAFVTKHRLKLHLRIHESSPLPE